MNWNTRKYLITGATLLALVSCGKNTTKDTHLSPGGLGEGTQCLSMEKLLAAMANFPPETPARKYTPDVQVTGSGNSRGNFLLQLARGNYVFEDSQIIQLE